MRRRAIALFLMVLTAARPMLADEMCKTAIGSMEAKPLKVVDGDTVDIQAIIPLPTNRTEEWRVRLLGIDAPEKNGKCLAEKEAARRATQAIADRLQESAVVILYGICEDTDSFGRLLARLSVKGGDLADYLIANHLARPLANGEARRGWCGANGELLP